MVILGKSFKSFSSRTFPENLRLSFSSVSIVFGTGVLMAVIEPLCLLKVHVLVGQYSVSINTSYCCILFLFLKLLFSIRFSPICILYLYITSWLPLLGFLYV